MFIQKHRTDIRNGMELGIYLDCRLMDDFETDARECMAFVLTPLVGRLSQRAFIF